MLRHPAFAFDLPVARGRDVAPGGGRRQGSLGEDGGQRCARFPVEGTCTAHVPVDLKLEAGAHAIRQPRPHARGFLFLRFVHLMLAVGWADRRHSQPGEGVARCLRTRRCPAAVRPLIGCRLPASGVASSPCGRGLLRREGRSFAADRACAMWRSLRGSWRAYLVAVCHDGHSGCCAILWRRGLSGCICETMPPLAAVTPGARYARRSAPIASSAVAAFEAFVFGPQFILLGQVGHVADEVGGQVEGID